ncbi:MAG: molecular chaperone HtpG, partial [Candidatus Omnitrophica bacterium]|nr:molecular chaperone HtpG [Candidatus Omnitrophota bacterium]
QKGELVSLKEYVQRMPDKQKDIYYLSGESREALERNPNLEYFLKNKIEVLLLSDPVDIFVLPSVHEYEKKHISPVDKSDIELKFEDSLEKPDDNLSKSLLGVFKEVLKDSVEDVVPSKRLVDSPVTLVAGKNSMDPQMERMMKLMDKDFERAKKILEVNMSHPVIRNLGRLYLSDAADPIMRKCISQLYEGALLISGDLASTNDFIKRMTEIMEKATQ